LLDCRVVNDFSLRCLGGCIRRKIGRIRADADMLRVAGDLADVVNVLASPNEPPIMTPCTPALTCASTFFSNINMSISSFVVKGVVRAGKIPFHSINSYFEDIYSKVFKN